MRLAFMGSPAFALAILKGVLQAGRTILCVYSQPPKPSGRGQKLTPTPVHAFAEAAGLEVRTPKTLRDATEQARFAALDLDLAIVAAYGLILPKAILDAPRLGCLNVHGSLLPRWRGAAPIQRAIMAGDAQTGIDIMQMEEGLDTGPVLLRASTPIGPDEDYGALHDRLADIGARLMVQALDDLEAGRLSPRPQSETGASYAHKIQAEELQMDWSRPARELERKIRALSPQPLAWTLLPLATGESVRVKIVSAQLGLAPAAARPGEILDDRLLIACGDGALRILRLRPEGKGDMGAEEFLRGVALAQGRVAG